MVFRKFKRQVLVKIESTEGTYSSPANTDFVEVLDDPTWSLSPQMIERNIARPAFTHIPHFHASTGIASGEAVSIGEVSFTVELAPPTAGHADGSDGDPAWAPLLQACGFDLLGSNGGMDAIQTGAITGGPYFHGERVTDGATGQAQVVSDTFTGDGVVYYIEGGGALADASTLTGAVSGATSTSSAAPAGVGCAFVLNTESGAGNGSSVSIRLDIDGIQLDLKGCRGNVVFSATSTDRMLMNFTMTGVVHQLITSSATTATSIAYDADLPPAFVDAQMFIRESTGTGTPFGSPLFQSISLDLGNEIVVREDAESPTGWKTAQITMRSPTVTFNPDAIEGGTTSAMVYDFFEKWVEGTLSSMRFQVGGTATKQYLFKAPAVQWDGIADGERDNITVFDCSGRLTGGSNGSSVVHTTFDGTSGTVQQYDNKGADNELVILCI